jgi:uncharacterized protein with GYD domain
MLTKLSPEASKAPSLMEDFEKRAMSHIKQECPDVRWLQSYVLLGPYDYLGIFTVPGADTALKVSAMICTFGGAHSEIWPASAWSGFKEILHSLPDR